MADKKVAQVFTENPITVIGNNDLFYVSQNGNVDAAINGANLKAQFVPTFPITVAQGGTGKTTLTANGIMYGDGTNVVKQIVLADNEFIRGSANGPVAATITQGNGIVVTSSPTGFEISSLAPSVPYSVANGGTGRTTLTENSILVGNGTNPVNYLALSENKTISANSSGAPIVVDLPLPTGFRVNYATTQAINGTYDANAGTLTALTSSTLSIDSSFPTVGSRILVKDNPFVENGIYEVIATANPWFLKRAADYNTADQINATALVTVMQGTVNFGSGWILSSYVTNASGDSKQYFRAGPAIQKSGNFDTTFNFSGNTTAVFPPGSYNVATTNDLGTFLTKSDNLNSVANKTTARSNLGVAINTDVQAYNAKLEAISNNPNNVVFDNSLIFTKIATQTLTGLSTYTFSGLNTTAYSELRLVLRAIMSSANNTFLQLAATSTGGALTSYNIQEMRYDQTSAVVSGNLSVNAFWGLTGIDGVSNIGPMGGGVSIYPNVGNYTVLEYSLSGYSAGGSFITRKGGGTAFMASGTLSALTLALSSGTFTSGVAVLYGIK